MPKLNYKVETDGMVRKLIFQLILSEKDIDKLSSLEVDKDGFIGKSIPQQLRKLADDIEKMETHNGS